MKFFSVTDNLYSKENGRPKLRQNRKLEISETKQRNDTEIPISWKLEMDVAILYRKRSYYSSTEENRIQQ